MKKNLRIPVVIKNKDIKYKLNKFNKITGIVLAYFLSGSALADVIWQEDFNDITLDGKGAVNSTLNMTNITKWSIDTSSAQLTASTDWFQVINQKFEGRDLDGIAYWQTETIDISNYQQLSLSLVASEDGTHEDLDFFNIEYSLDGGEFSTAQNSGTSELPLTGNFTSQQINIEIPSGSTIAIRISMLNNAGAEYISFDDLVLSGTLNGEEPGEGETEEPNNGDPTTITNACYNCPDLTKIANAETFNDATYYANIYAALSASYSQSQLKDSLSNIISTGHQPLTYSEVWTALTETDEDPFNSDNVLLIYKGTSIAKFSNGSGSQSSNPDNWNREHVWAKSHGFPSSSTTAYTDIHHLRPSDISVNASRGNLDFDYSDNVLPEAPANKYDSNSFEPRDSVKGDVARMVFYMDVRYQGLDAQTPDLVLVNQLTSVGEAKLGKLCALLTWHAADPVDNIEKSRNNVIYEFQGNRNPFIDHPEWVNSVFSANCSGENPTDPTDPTVPTDPTDPTPGNSDLFISEYVEGSSYNKAIEIFNPTSAVVPLTNWALKLYSNGSNEPTSTLALSGDILANDVLVLGSSQITDSSALKAYIDVFSSAINFNGDDYLELTYNGNVVDSFGTKGARQSWGTNITLTRKASVTQGDTVVNDVFDRTIEWDEHASDTFTFLGAHQFDGEGEGGGNEIPPTSTLGVCFDEATLISTIQGNSQSSPLVGETKVVEAVVTLTANNLSGFFVQEEASNSDNDNSTSEGLFISLNNKAQMPSVGQLVRAKGSIKEEYARTQLTLDEALLDCGVATPIIATEFSLPINQLDSFESLEGMLVTNSQVLSVADTYNLSRFGQFTVSNGRLIIPTNIFTANSPQAIALADKNSKNRLLIDDISNAQNPDPVPFPSDGLAHTNTLRLGDAVRDLIGVIDYSYSNYQLLPTTTPTFEQANERKLQPQLTNVADIKVASFNVLNYFNGDGQGGGFPTSRGATNAAEFVRQSSKIVAALSEIDADIIGLMEIENDGFSELSAIANLTRELNSLVGANTYQYVSLDANNIGSDEITVGLLYKPSKVSLVNNAVTLDSSPFDYGNRQPLVQSFNSIANAKVFTVAVNHFKSKGSCGSATGNNMDLNDGQSCWNELRTQAAAKLMTWLESNPTNVNEQNTLIIGDLNAYGQEDPIREFTNNSYHNLLANYLGSSAYSYSFGGEIGYLDHAIANEAMSALVDNVTVWHINADEPRTFDYNTENKSDAQLDSLYSADPFRASDHDPIIVSLNLTSTASLIGDVDDDNDIDMNDIRLFSQQLREGVVFDISYDFNNDTLVNANDVRALMGLCTRSRCALN